MRHIAEHVVELALDEEIVEWKTELYLILDRELVYCVTRSEYGVVRIAVALLQSQIWHHRDVEQVGILEVVNGLLNSVYAEVGGEFILITNAHRGENGGRFVDAAYFRGHFVVQKVGNTLVWKLDEEANAGEQKDEPHDFEGPTLRHDHIGQTVHGRIGEDIADDFFEKHQILAGGRMLFPEFGRFLVVHV